MKKIKKMFQYDLKELPDIQAEMTQEGRFYHTPGGGFYPSVTNFLGSFGNEGIEKWRKRVGDDAADRRTYLASSRGNEVHDALESYLREESPLQMKPMTRSLYDQVVPVLDEHVSTIYSIEATLYSDTLKLAGRTDLIGLWDDEPAIIDFKTSDNMKQESWCEKYFLQETCYSIMFQELIDIKCHKLVTIVTTQHEGLQVLVRKRSKYLKKLFNMIKQYNKQET